MVLEVLDKLLCTAVLALSLTSLEPLSWLDSFGEFMTQQKAVGL